MPHLLIQWFIHNSLLIRLFAYLQSYQRCHWTGPSTNHAWPLVLGEEHTFAYKDLWPTWVSRKTDYKSF